MRKETPSTVNIELPIAELATGPIAPAIDPDHPFWRVLADWDDPPGAARLRLGFTAN